MALCGNDVTPLSATPFVVGGTEGRDWEWEGGREGGSHTALTPPPRPQPHITLTLTHSSLTHSSLTHSSLTHSADSALLSK